MISYYKVAASLFDQLQAESERQASYSNPRDIDLGHDTEGIATPRHLIPALGGEVAGEAGALGGKLVSKVLSAAGVPIDQVLQTGYGTNYSDAQDAIAAERALSSGKQQAYADAARRLADAAGINIPIGDKFLGRGVDLAAAVAPGINQALEVADPSFTGRLDPLVQATYRLNGGRFDPTTFHALRQNFDQMYASGAFGQVPKAQALSALPASLDLLGPNATLQQVANINAAAHALVSTGIAPTYGEALRLVGDFDAQSVARDPRQVQAFADQARAASRQFGVSGNMLGAAAKHMRGAGVSAPQAAAAVVSAGELQRVLGDGGTANRAILTNTSNTLAGRNNTAAILEAAGLMDPAVKSRVDAMLARGDHAGVRALAGRYMSNPAVMEAASRMDGSGVYARADVNGARALNLAEAHQYMENEGIKAPADLKRRLQQNDWSGLDPRTALAFMNGGKTKGALGGTIVSSQTLSTPKTPQITPKRLGLNYPVKPS